MCVFVRESWQGWDCEAFLLRIRPDLGWIIAHLAHGGGNLDWNQNWHAIQQESPEALQEEVRAVVATNSQDIVVITGAWLVRYALGASSGKRHSVGREVGRRPFSRRIRSTVFCEAVFNLVYNVQLERVQTDRKENRSK